MFTITVNNKEYCCETDKTLMDFLRDDLHIYSVKNGCHEGACGTCTVLVDGKASRACILKLSRLAGKNIQTVEGFSNREKDVYSYAFAKAGSVQCGFCIPGMVMAAKGLITANPNPNREDVKKAIRTNICRCTGYQKIEDGILLAAEYLRTGKEVPKHTMKAQVGQRIFRVDARAKTLGEAKYADDYVFEDMLHAKNLFTAHARAKILSMNFEEASKMDGVVAIFTAKDIPGKRYIGHLAKDWPGMIDIGEETKHIGDTLAMVVAHTYEQAVAASKAIEVEYEVKKPICSPEEAMKEGAHQIHGEGFYQFGNIRIPENNRFDHQEVKRGDVEKAFAQSVYLAEGTFEMPFTEHAFMEPETAIGMPDGDDGVHVITGAQGIYDEKHELSDYLGIPMEKVRCQSAYVGGGFGGKEDMSVQHQAALCAFLLKRPVKVRFTRQESINYHPKRHAMKITMKLGCDKDGKILGMQAHLLSDTGAYASLGGPVLQRACTHAGGPYAYENVNITGDAYYTNNPPAGAFRGFGVTQSVFAIESLLNHIADQMGIDGWEIRRRNAAKEGQSLPNGQICGPDVGIIECLDAVKDDFYRYEKDPNYVVGIAAAMKNAGIGVGLVDPGRCNIQIKDGKLHCYSSAAGIGQGVATVIWQMVGEATGIDGEKIIVHEPDTYTSPDAGTTTASRQTVFTGNAAKLAALQLAEDLKNGLTLEELEGKIYEGEFDFKTDPIMSDKPNPVSHISYGFGCQLYVLDRQGKMVEVIAAHDVGKAINPLSLEGQIEGGVAMGIGYGLTEVFPLKDGIPQGKLGTIGLIKADQMPHVKSLIVEKNPSRVAYGAKGVGEIVCTMGAPALQNAYFKLDGKYRTTLPLEDTFYRKPKK